MLTLYACLHSPLLSPSLSLSVSLSLCLSITGEMEEAELPRKGLTFTDEKDQTDGSISKIRDETTLREEGSKSDFTMEEQLPDRGDFGGDFLTEGFGGFDGFGDGEMMDMGLEPGISDINLEEGQEEGAAGAKEGNGCLHRSIGQAVS